MRAGELDDLLEFWRRGRRDGDFELGLELGLRYLLASPQFVFRFESEPSAEAETGVFRVDDLALASRLSFFLWSSIPDEELLTVAEAGRLSEPDELARQLDRMLTDPKSWALVENFAGQWLYLRNLEGRTPDPLTYSDWDDNLRPLDAPRDRAVLQQHPARGQERARSADGGLHLRQRAAGPSSTASTASTAIASGACRSRTRIATGCSATLRSSP